ncbi:MAG: hypothetical protein ACO2ZD_11420, partial [Pseudomonadales bacterium]
YPDLWNKHTLQIQANQIHRSPSSMLRGALFHGRGDASMSEATALILNLAIALSSRHFHILE